MRQAVLGRRRLNSFQSEFSTILSDLGMFLAQGPPGELRAVVRGGRGDAGVRGRAGRVPRRRAGRAGHAAARRLRLPRDGLRAALRLPGLAAAALAQPLRR